MNYLSPPIWLGLGFLTGWVYVKPNPIIAILWAIALYAMVLWIMRDVETSAPPSDNPPS